MKRASFWATIWGFTLMPLLFWGCTGGNSSASPATALSVASQVSVVDTQSSTNNKVQALSIGLATLGLAVSDLPSNSDYFNDKQNVYTQERSAEAFDTVNEILCMIAQTRYDAMLNAGTYKAQIDNNKCSKNSDSASSAGQSSQNQSSSSTAPSYELWTVDSSRTDGNSPHILKAWIHEEASEHEPGKLIIAKLTITESASTTNPYGIFTLNFQAHPVINDVAIVGVTVFKGYLNAEKDTTTGKVLLKFVVEGGFDQDGDGTNDSVFNEKSVLDRAVDGSTGSGTTSVADTFGNESKSAQFDIAFNSTSFRRENVNDTSDDFCYSRSAFDETAWRYGLYDSTGSRVNINSGFPIKKGNAYGWIGYYGLWFPESVTINNGDTVYKVAYGANGETATPYTVVKIGGKLKKHTKHTTTLGEIKNIPMDGWMEQSGQSMINYRVKWDATAQQFKKFQKLNQTTFMWENITEAAIDLSRSALVN